MLKKHNISDYYSSMFGFFFVLGVFFIIISSNFLSEGMFMDGILYSIIAENLSKSIGSFWHLQTDNHAAFYGHPPLAMGIQSLFYHIFGNAYWVDKLYSMSTFGISALLIVLLWKELKFPLKHAWWTWFFWLTIPLVCWCSTNNLLENTMGVFILLSVLFYLKSLKKIRFFFCFLSGTMLFLAFLCKGLTGLYPLVFPIIYCLCVRNKKLLSACGDVLIILLGLLLPLALLLTISSNAADFIKKYWQIQLVGSLTGEHYVNTRFYILIQMICELIIPAIGLGLTLLYFLKKKVLTMNENCIKIAISFALLALCGVLPIMVSMKQRSFYILTVFPFFAIAMSALLVPTLTSFSLSPNMRKWMKVVSALVFMVGIGLNVYFCGKIGRDKVLLSDIHLLLNEIPAQSAVNMDDNLELNYSFIFYCARYQEICVMTGNQQELKIVLAEHTDKLKNEGYELVETGAQSLCLMKKTGN